MYRCIKTFIVPFWDVYNKDGRPIKVEKGSFWKICEHNLMTIDDFILENNEADWIGISKETLSRFFVVVNNNE